MKTTLPSVRIGAALACAGAALALGAAGAKAQSTDADAFPSFESYIKISGEAPWMTGDRAAFATRADTPNTGAVGIEDLYYTKDLPNNSTVTFDGHGLAGSDDYLAQLDLSQDGLGSIEVGYKRFRIFYDGVGGFFPLADQFQVMSPEGLHIDRSAFWAKATIARPNAPVFTVEFHDEIRTGQKDSTEWAAIINPDATVVNGALVGNAAPNNTPYIDPNLLSVAEHHDILSATATDTLGKTTETLKATFDWVSNLDTRYYVRYPNSNVLADPTVDVLDDQQAEKTHTFQVLNQTETEFNSQWALDTGLTFVHTSGEDGGLWITPAYSSTAKGIYPAETAADIYAAPEAYDYVGNVFLKYTPTPDWLAEAGFRAESSVISDGGGFTTTSLASTATSISPAFVTTANDLTYSHYLDHMATPEISVDWHALNNLSLYGTFDKQITHGTQHWINPYAAVTTTGAGVVTTATAPIGSVYDQDANQDYENAKIGADWQVDPAVTIRVDVYRRDHQNEFIGANDLVGTASYGAFFATGYTLTGANLSVVCKLTPQVTFTTRYQPQAGNMSVLGNSVTGGDGSEVTSGRLRTQLVSETVDWDPYKQFYAQANINIVYSYIQTAYPTVVTSATAPVPTPIVNANNNYVTGSVLFGFVLDKQTDAEIQGNWEQATDYNPQVAYGGQPYGATFLYESATAGLKHKFTDRLLGDGKIGYLRSTDGTTGGFTNYRGPLAYVSLEYAL